MDADSHGSETELTEAVIGSAFELMKVIGSGFLEKVYERALIGEMALRWRGSQGAGFASGMYKVHYAGEYMAGLIVAGTVIAELKCVERLTNEAWRKVLIT